MVVGGNPFSPLLGLRNLYHIIEQLIKEVEAFQTFLYCP